jgi:hypothetical protein
MLQRLTPDSDKAAGAMEEIGLRAYDAQGNFIGLEAVAGQLQDGLSGLTQEQRDATLETIFGADAVRAAGLLYKEGADGVREYDLAVRDSGAAARVAAISQDNLRGDIEKLEGAVSDFAISMGEVGNGPLRDLVQGVTGVVDSIGDLPAPAQTALFWTAALGSAALVTGGGMMVLLPKIVETKDAMRELGLTGPKASKAMKGLGVAVGAGAALAAVAAGLVQIKNASTGAVPGIEATTAALLEMDKAGSDASLDQLFASIDVGSQGFNDLESAFKRVTDKSWRQEFNDNIAGMFGEVNENSQAHEVFDNIGDSLARMVQQGQANEAGQQFDAMAKALGLSGEEVDELLKLMPSYSEAVQGAANETATTADNTEGLSQNLQNLADDTEAAQQATEDYLQSLRDAGLAVLDSRGAQRALKEALAEVDDKLKENGRTLNENTEKGRANAEFLDDLAKKHLDAAEAVLAETGSEEKHRASLLKSRDSLIQTYKQFDNNQKRAEAYADSIIKIPAARTTTVDIANYANAWGKANSLRKEIDKITGKTVYVNVIERQAGQAGGSTRGGQVKGAAKGGAIVGIGSGTSDSIHARLSNGEHVLTAQDVKNLGGQAAVYRLRELAMSGQLNARPFATGGAVGSAPTPGEVVFHVRIELIGQHAIRDTADDEQQHAEHGCGFWTTGARGGRTRPRETT